MKIILDGMFHQLYEELANQPYAASFFYAYVNQEYLDEAIPELGVLRKAIANVTKHDFGMINREISGFQQLTADIIKRFPIQTQLRDILFLYCGHIEAFMNEWV